MGQPRPLFHLFLVFSSKQYNFYNKSMRKNVMSIRCRDLNPRPLERESPRITTRPGLLPILSYTSPPTLSSFTKDDSHELRLYTVQESFLILTYFLNIPASLGLFWSHRNSITNYNGINRKSIGVVHGIWTRGCGRRTHWVLVASNEVFYESQYYSY